MMPPASRRHGTFVLVVAFVFMQLLLWPARRAGAAEYTVGGHGPSGWDSGINYATWAQEQAFTVGDVLVFEYVKTQHNVYEVTESAYRSCDVSGGAGVLATYATGFDRVQLMEAKTYWFICEVPGHCMGGMRVAVNVSAWPAGGGSALPSPDVPPLPPPPPPPPSASPAGGCRSWMAWGGPVLLGVHALVNWAS